MSRMFNGLNGKELAHVISMEIGELLATDSRFEREDPITSALVIYTADIEREPGRELSFNLQLTHLFKPPAGQALTPATLRPRILAEIARDLELDLRFSLNITYPKVTYRARLNLELKTSAGVIERTVERAIDQAPSSLIDLTAPRPVILTDSGSVAINPDGKRIRELEQELVRLRSGQSSAPAFVTGMSVVPGSSPAALHRIADVGQGDMEMERGWRAAPPPEVAFGTGDGRGSPARIVPSGADYAERVERMEMAVQHPPLDDGGMGAPDAIRREAGLPVLTTQVGVAGQMVDLPSGTF